MTLQERVRLGFSKRSKDPVAWALVTPLGSTHTILRGQDLWFHLPLKYLHTQRTLQPVL